MNLTPTSVVVIYCAAVLHAVEGAILLHSRAADNSIPMAALLQAFAGQRISLGLTMILAACLATIAAGQRGSMISLVALLPQQILLVITAIGALVFSYLGHYADGYVPDGGGLFIFADQLPRMLLAIAHPVAIYTWVWLGRPFEGKRRTAERIITDAKRCLVDDPEDPVLVIPVDELREIVETNL